MTDLDILYEKVFGEGVIKEIEKVGPNRLARAFIYLSSIARYLSSFYYRAKSVLKRKYPEYNERVSKIYDNMDNVRKRCNEIQKELRNNIPESELDEYQKMIYQLIPVLRTAYKEMKRYSKKSMILKAKMEETVNYITRVINGLDVSYHVNRRIEKIVK